MASFLLRNMQIISRITTDGIQIVASHLARYEDKSIVTHMDLLSAFATASWNYNMVGSPAPSGKPIIYSLKEFFDSRKDLSDRVWFSGLKKLVNFCYLAYHTDGYKYT